MLHGTLDRRRFLTTSSTIVAGIALGVKRLAASDVGSHTPYDIFAEPIAPDTLRALATAAIEAAIADGATFADVRVAVRQRYGIAMVGDGPTNGITLRATFEAGVRAKGNGPFAFHYTNTPTIDALRNTAKAAASQARGFSALSRDPVMLAKTTPAHGDWTTPHTIDPFAVPLAEQIDMIGAMYHAVKGHLEAKASGGAGVGWERETRVCATSEGTLVTQTFLRLMGGITGGVYVKNNYTLKLIPDGMTGGYELFTGAAVQERLKQAVEAGLPYARLTSTTMEVGRYPVVLDGTAMGSVILSTLSPAVQLDRVLGLEAGASGTSFLSPLDDVISATLFSPVLNVHASRPFGLLTGARWDDEGSEATTVPLVDHGRLVTLLGDRQTISALSGRKNTSYDTSTVPGFVAAETADRPPTIGSGHLTVTPSTERASRDELIGGISHGVLVTGETYVHSDQQLATGLLTGGSIYEIRNGKIVAEVEGVGLQFRTKTLLKNIAAIGDNTTVGSRHWPQNKGAPEQPVHGSVSAPAAVCPALDLVQLTGR